MAETTAETVEKTEQEGTNERPFHAPWEKTELKDDGTGLIRTLYVFDGVALGIGEKKIPIVFKHPLDPLTSEQLDDKAIPIRKRLDSVVKAIDYFEIPRTELTNSFSQESIPRPENFDYEIITAMAACSLYEENGNIKPYDDGEGWALFTSYLISNGRNPEMANQCLDRLKKRVHYLPTERKGPPPVDKLFKERPSWGEVPFEKITMVHATNYLPHVANDRAAVLPRIDTDEVPRWTLHFFGNGMVEEHSVGGLVHQSWEGQKYAVVVSFAGVVSSNGLPANIFGSDTFWAVEPGKGLRLPAETIILAPSSEIEELRQKYQPFGIEVKGYSDNTPLRPAVKEVFDEKGIPWVEKANPEIPSPGDFTLGKLLELPAVRHEQTNEGHLDYMFTGNCMKAIEYGAKCLSEGIKILTPEEEMLIKVRLDQYVTSKGKRALSAAISNCRNYIIQDLPKRNHARITEKALQTALLAGFL